jgi:hypothetical protein
VDPLLVRPLLRPLAIEPRQILARRLFDPLGLRQLDQKLPVTLNTADVAPGKQAVEELERIVAQILARWPDTRIVVRGDSGFCNDEVMRWCEESGVDYILGLAQNSRLRAEIAGEMADAKAEHARTGEEARVFKDYRYKTRDSWSCERRVVGKAEYSIPTWPRTRPSETASPVGLYPW